MSQIQVGDTVLLPGGIIGRVNYVSGGELIPDDCDVESLENVAKFEDGEEFITDTLVNLAVGPVDYATLDSLVEWMG